VLVLHRVQKREYDGQRAVGGERQGLLEPEEVYGPGRVGDAVAAVGQEESGGCRVRVLAVAPVGDADGVRARSRLRVGAFQGRDQQAGSEPGG
jgi:hypothetical protein